jgi:hypothetical protein
MIYQKSAGQLFVIDAIYGTLLHRPANPSGLTAFSTRASLCRYS